MHCVKRSNIMCSVHIDPPSVTGDSESGKALEILDRPPELLVGLIAHCLYARIGVSSAKVTKLP